MLTILTDNIIDQNHFGNIIMTSLSNSRNSFGSIWSDRFCNEEINTKAIVQGKNSNFKRILKCSWFYENGVGKKIVSPSKLKLWTFFWDQGEYEWPLIHSSTIPVTYI